MLNKRVVQLVRLKDANILAICPKCTLPTAEGQLVPYPTSLSQETIVKMDGIGVDEDGCQDENPVHCRLSPELWLRIFCYLDRNDTDSCGAVCQSW